MRMRKKILLWFAGILGFLMVFILTLALFASRFIDAKYVKEKILANISQKVTGKVDFQRVDTSFFPRPRVTIHQAQLSLPEKAEGTIKSLKIYPALVPLFSGEVKIAKIQIESPDFLFSLPKKEPLSIAEIEEKVSHILNNLASNAPDLVILIKKGKVNLSRNNQKLLSFENIDSRIVFPPEELKLTVKCNSKFSKSISINGHLRQKNFSFTNVALDLEAREVNISLTQDATFFLAGDAPIVQQIFAFIKGGTVPFIAIHSQGKSIVDLGKTENILIKGKVDQGEIFIPGPQFDFKNVKGDCVISRGILDGENIGAKLGNAELRGGKLKVGLRGADAPLHLDTLAKVSLEELSHLLKRVIKDEAFRRELDSIQKINGYAQGKLVLGKSIASIQPQVDVSEFTLSTTYQRIPYPIEIKGGQFLYDDKKVQVKNLSGTVGKSSFSGLTAGLTFGNVPYLEITSGKSFVSLEEIHRWLLSYEKLKAPLKNISSLKGNVKLFSINFIGPLQNSQEWRFRLIGSTENIAINSSLLPGMLTIIAKKFDLTPKQLVFTDAQTSSLDASYSISGILKDPLEGFQNADITFKGTIGPKTAQWIKDIIKLPELRIDQRFSFSQSHLLWEKSGNVFFQGNAKAQNGADVSIDVIKNPRGLKINKLFIYDENSRATLTLNLQEKTLGLSFVGKLNSLTLAKLSTISYIPEGFVQGNLRTEIDREKPLRSTVQGNLSGAKIVIPWKEKVPLTIENISLNADTNRMNVESALIKLDDNDLSLHGSLNFTDKGIATDMDIVADRITWETMRKVIEGENKEKDAKKKDYQWNLPIYGTLRLKSNNFVYDKLTVSPLYADIAFSPDLVTVNVIKALVCGISTPGNVKIIHDNLQCNFNPHAIGQELKPTLACLLRTKESLQANLILMVH